MSDRIVPLHVYDENFMKSYLLPDREECSICLDNDEFTYKSWIRLKS
jgi:hypothetical protein